MNKNMLTTNQAYKINKVKRALIDDSRIIIIKGSEGSGKTTILKFINLELSNSPDRYKCISIDGIDSLHVSDYETFRLGLQANNDSKHSIDKKAFVKEVVKTVPTVGGILGWLVDALTNASPVDKAVLSETEIELMSLLKSSIKLTEGVLIIDNLSYIDEASKSLIFKIINYINTNSTYTSNLKVIIALNTDTELDFDKWLSHSNIDSMVIYLEQVTKSDIRKFLSRASISTENLHSESLVDLLYDLSDGNIYLINDLIQSYEGLNGVKHTINKYNQKLTPSQQLNKVIDERIKKLDPKSELVNKVLGVASLIGFKFSVRELEYVTKLCHSEINNILETTNNSRLTITGGDNSYEFAYQILRNIFRSRMDKHPKRSVYYKQVEACLKYMNPSSYYKRAEFIFEIGDINSAIGLYILGYIQELRKQLESCTKRVSLISNLAREQNMSNYVILMTNAYAAFHGMRYHDCIRFVEQIDETINSKLYIEAEYLKAIASKKVYTVDSSQLHYAIERLDYIYHNIEDEKEQWSRVSSTLMALYYDSAHDNKKAFRIYRKLVHYFGERMTFDPSSEISLHILFRKSNMFFASDIAIEKISKSVEFFKEKSYELDYLKSVCNYLAVSITLGRYSEGYKVLEECIMNSNRDLLSNFYYLANNAILCGYYSYELNADESIELIKQAISKIVDMDDKVIFLNNLGVLYSLNGQAKKAYTVFSELITNEFVQTDDYYNYFVRMNYASLLYLNLDYAKAEKMFHSVSETTPFISQFEKHYLLMRQELFEELLNSKAEIGVEEADEYFINMKSKYLGEGWKHFGRFFLTSDIQYWSES